MLFSSYAKGDQAIPFGSDTRFQDSASDGARTGGDPTYATDIGHFVELIEVCNGKPGFQLIHLSALPIHL